MSMKIINKLLTNVNRCECQNWYERLKFFRENILEISQGKFAKLLDLDTSRISRYETGRGAKELTFNLKNRIKQAFGEKVAEWVDTGKIKEKQEGNGIVNNIGTIQGSNVANKMQAHSIVAQGGEPLSTYERALIDAFREKSKGRDQVALLAKVLQCLEKALQDENEGST